MDAENEKETEQQSHYKLGAVFLIVALLLTLYPRDWRGTPDTRNELGFCCRTVTTLSTILKNKTQALLR